MAAKATFEIPAKALPKRLPLRQDEGHRQERGT
jgi:hypothetical protein